MESRNSLDLKMLGTEIKRFMMAYKFALDEMNTKINILKEEFQYIHDYNPIEHVKSRIKSPESILKKVKKKGCDLTLPSIKANIKDIAGIRITCSFISDIYKVSEILTNQKDISVINFKDYIKNPKPNGYQSLHLLLQIPVFMSDHEELVNVEVQIRTIAMDFWASLEHKIYYKYKKDVPPNLVLELKEAAIAAAGLDRNMERLNKEIMTFKHPKENGEELFYLDNNSEKFTQQLKFFQSLIPQKTC